jgi:hypothetical protein
MTAFSDVIRDDIWTILSGRYSTVRHGGHPSDADEFRRERPFWPDMCFHAAHTVDGPFGRQICITFTPVKEPDAVYGYKIDVDKSVAAWSERVGIRDPRRSTAMFAAELVWYMVAYIGSTDLKTCVDRGDGVRWINTGADVFEPLPEPLATAGLHSA